MMSHEIKMSLQTFSNINSWTLWDKRADTRRSSSSQSIAESTAQLNCAAVSNKLELNIRENISSPIQSRLRKTITTTSLSVNPLFYTDGRVLPEPRISNPHCWLFRNEITLPQQNWIPKIIAHLNNRQLEKYKTSNCYWRREYIYHKSSQNHLPYIPLPTTTSYTGGWRTSGCSPIHPNKNPGIHLRLAEPFSTWTSGEFNQFKFPLRRMQHCT